MNSYNNSWHVTYQAGWRPGKAYVIIKIITNKLQIIKVIFCQSRHWGSKIFYIYSRLIDTRSMINAINQYRWTLGKWLADKPPRTRINIGNLQQVTSNPLSIFSYKLTPQPEWVHLKPAPAYSQCGNTKPRDAFKLQYSPKGRASLDMVVYVSLTKHIP